MEKVKERESERMALNSVPASTLAISNTRARNNVVPVDLRDYGNIALSF